MLDIRNLSAGYPGNPVLRDISLSIPEGAVTVIVGPNGSGKSTLLKALAGILPASGSVRLEGLELLELSGRELAKKVAFLPQNRAVPEITVKNLVLHGRFPYLSYPRRYRPEDHKAAEAAMTKMGISDLADRSLATLSGGQRQKVYIAMALECGDSLVILSRGQCLFQGSAEETFRSGCLDRAFRVAVKRFRTEAGWKYYYDTHP